MRYVNATMPEEHRIDFGRFDHRLLEFRDWCHESFNQMFMNLGFSFVRVGS